MFVNVKKSVQELNQALTNQIVSSIAPTSTTSPSTDAVHAAEMVAHTSTLTNDTLASVLNLDKSDREEPVKNPPTSVS